MKESLKIFISKLNPNPAYPLGSNCRNHRVRFLVLFFIPLLLFHFSFLRGQVNDTSFYSPVLDQTINVDVYLPPGYSSSIDTLYPVIYFLHGWGGSENSADLVMSKAEELINAGTIDPLIIVCPNNSAVPFNGSFYVNSVTSGDYEDFHITDLIQWIDSTYRTADRKAHRSIMGQSMGGYGAFRYAILHDSLFRAIAAHASALNFEVAKEGVKSLVLQEHPAGAPYTYDYENDGDVTKMIFAAAGAFSPNLTSPQTYVNPQIIEFPLDEDGNIIDSIFQKWQEFDIVSDLDLLTPDDSVALFFGAGQNDELTLYDPNVAFQDTLDDYGLAYSFFDHADSHAMPESFREEALIFLDSVMADPLYNNGCPNPSELVVSDITDTSAVLSWIENGSATAWQIAIDSAGLDTTLVTPIDITENPYLVSTLNASYTYECYVRSSCGDGFYSDWIGPYTFQTYGDTLLDAVLPWVEKWENTSNDLTRINKQFYRSDEFIWTFEPERVNENRCRWGTAAHQTRYGNGALTLDKYPNNGIYSLSTAILTLNLANYAESTDLELTFWYSDHGDETNSEDRIWIRGSEDDAWITLYHLEPGDWTDNVYSYVAGLDIDEALSSASPSQNASETFQIKFVQKGKTFTPGDGISFDNIMISTCATPSNQTVSNLGVTSAQLNWQANGNESEWQILFDTAGFDTTGVTPQVISTNPYTISGLDTNTMYDWYVRAWCGEGDTSAWIGPNTFTTWRFVRKAPYIIYGGVNTEMQIHWQLSSTSTAILEWGADTTYGSSVEVSEYGDAHQHKYTLTGLTPSEKYYFRVRVGLEVFTGNFTAAPPENELPYSIYAYGDSRTLTIRHDSVAASILRNMEADTASQTILLSSGDLVTNGDVDAQWDDDIFSDRFPNLRKLFSVLPFQAAIGNHEESGVLYAGFFPYPFIGGRYWSYDYGDVHITVLDQYTDYSVGSAQYNWLVNDLASTTKKWKILLLHEPGWHAGPQNNFYVKTTIHNLCRDNGIQFLIAGHNHNYVHCLVEGVHHVTTGGGGAQLYDVNFAYDSIVFATKQLHFTKFNFIGDTCTVFAINVNSDTIDRFDVDLSPCFRPSNLAVSDLTNSSALLSWTENGDAEQWQVMLDTAGFDTTAYVPVLIGANPYP
ncbi:MAG: alpha/beta hydrolase-fold protein, partial [bacterium]